MSLIQRFAALAALLIGGSTAALASTPTTTIHACYDKGTGDVRIVATASLCVSTSVIAASTAAWIGYPAFINLKFARMIA